MTGSEINPAELLYEHVIAAHLDAGFVERPWLAGRIERHFRDPDCRFVLLTGGPGTGKSTVLAWLTRRHSLSPRYFLRRLSSHPLASGDAWSLLLSIGHQLAVLRPEIMRADLDVRVSQVVGQVTGDVVGVRVGVLHVSPFQHTAVQVQQRAHTVAGRMVGLEIGRMVADPRLNDLGNLQHLAMIEPAIRLATTDPAALVVILIDAVDELRFQWNTARGDVLEWLAECPELPPNLRIVLTARPDRQLLQRFRLAQSHRIREEPIEPAAPEVHADLLAYTRNLLAEPELAHLHPPDPRLPTRIAAHAAGSFLYLSLWGNGLRDALATGDHTRIAALTNLSALPTGLHGIYEYFLSLIRDTVRKRAGPSWSHPWNHVYRAILEPLAIAQSPLPRNTLLLLANLESNRPAATEALAELSQFLHEDPTGIRLFHTTLADFLTSTDPSRIMDDWHVDAGDTHYRTAQRLIAEHGDSWPDCADPYALTHTATHLVAAIRTADTSSLRRHSTHALSTLLTDPTFAITKALRLGIDPMLTDYIAAHTTLPEPAQPALATTLARVLARLVDHGVPNLADTLHAVLGYRLDTVTLHQKVLTSLSDPAYLQEFVTTDTLRTTALIAFTHAQATRLRRTGIPANLTEARRLLLTAISTAETVDTPALSALYYDLGYLDFLHGDPHRATSWLTRSITAAEQSGDHTAAWISRLVSLRISLLAGTTDPATYRTTHQAALEYLTSAQAQGPHVTRWLTTVHSQLLDLGLWLEDPNTIATELAALEESPWYQQTARNDYLLRYRARAAAIAGDPAEACTLFANILADDLTDPPSHREELARDLYYYGRALATIGDSTAARRMWNLGLRCPDNAANWPWKPRITDARG